MARVIAIGSILWPLLLGGSVYQRAFGAPAAWPFVLVAAASTVCHQIPERSFKTAGVQWPVCARCSGLYLSAPAGAVAALLASRRKARRAVLTALAVAAVPTAITIAIQWTDIADTSNMTRLLTALPLGAAIGYTLVWTAGSPRESIG